jgi:hypothetical protein
MLRNHSFRKAHIALAIAAPLMVIGRIALGSDASEAEVQVVTLLSFGVMIAAVIIQYELEYRRERRSCRSRNEND